MTKRRLHGLEEDQKIILSLAFSLGAILLALAGLGIWRHLSWLAEIIHGLGGASVP